MLSSAPSHVVHTTFSLVSSSHPNISRISLDALGIILPSIIVWVIRYLHIKWSPGQWNMIGENIAQLLFTQARCFLLWSRWIAFCSRIAVMSWRLWDIYTLRMRNPRMLARDGWRLSFFFIGDWRSQPKPSCWEEPAFWGRDKIRISDYTADYFTSSHAIQDVITLTNQDIMNNFCLGFCNTADRWKWLFTCCIWTASVRGYLNHCQHEPTSWCLRKRICCFNALSRG